VTGQSWKEIGGRFENGNLNEIILFKINYLKLILVI